MKLQWARAATKHRISRERSRYVIEHCGLRFEEEPHAGAPAGASMRFVFQWETATREARPDLSTENHACLREDLAEWLGKIVVRHGAEAALILYPEDERAQRLFGEIENLGSDFLPERSTSVMAI